jgi:signal transduction histidine kinase
VDPIKSTISDAMEARDTKSSAELAGAVTTMKGWCELENSEPRRFEEPRDEPERTADMARLAACVTHEINNILAIILLNAELLGDCVGNDNKQLRAVIRATSRGAEMAQQLLAFASRQRLNPRVLDLGNLAEGMIVSLMQTLGETIKLELRQAPHLRPVIADPVQLENVLLNLAGNARDAMPLGGRLVIEIANVTVKPEQAGVQPDSAVADYVVLAVSDTGRGIAPDMIERVFEPFLTTKDAGIGLGLALVHGFARLSGGHVTIESVLGRGTTVKLYLPSLTGAGDIAQNRTRAETC